MNEWYKAIATWGIGDTVTTIIGITLFGASEINPVGKALISGLPHFTGLILAKIIGLLLIYWICKNMLSANSQWGGKTLFYMGSVITVWNTLMILSTVF